MNGKSMQHSGTSPNAQMRMSADARLRMRATEKVVLRYYNDMGKNKGNCTWGPGILAHKGVCNEEELVRKVTLMAVETEFDRRVAEAERYVKQAVTKAVLNQAQFDALVSLTYNAGVRNVRGTYELVNQNNFSAAAANISRMVKVSIIEHGKKKEVVAPGLIKRREEESAPFRVKADLLQ
jgi:GH24 family phage-related lysozyme (muramidase)